MRDWIAVIMAILGVLLVLAGATIIVLRALSASDTPPASGTHSYGESTTEVTTTGSRPAVPARLAQAARRMPAADRLIAWGIVLLILAAIAAGAIGFKIDLSANSG
jgi:hypothetical protein